MSKCYDNPDYDDSESDIQNTWNQPHKVEQKQNIIDMMKGDEELGLYDEILPQQIWNEEKMKGIKQLIQDHKKETLEEFAERLCPNKQVEYDMIIEGAKWQQDKICDSEVLQRIRASKSDAEARRIIRTL